MSLREIDALIEKKEYNVALEELSHFIKAHPLQFDDAQKRIRLIMKERARFNADASQLISRMAEQASSDEPTSEEKEAEKVRIINEMERSERHRSQESVALTNDARRTVALQYYIARANEIMRAGSALVASGATNESDYARAATAFLECASLKPAVSDVIYTGEQVIPVTYSSTLTAAVDNAVRETSVQVSSLADLFAVCQNATDAFLAAVTACDVPGAQSCFEPLERAYNALADCRSSIVQQARVLKECDDAVLAQYPDLGTSYIAFARLGVHGSAESPDTGILSAIDAFWNVRLEAMKQALYETTKTALSGVVTCLPQETLFLQTEYKDAQALFAAVSQLAVMGKRLQAFYTLISVPASRFTAYTNSMEFVRTLSADSFLQATERVQKVAVQNQKTEETLQSASPAFRDVADAVAFYERTLQLSLDAQSEPHFTAELQREKKAHETQPERSESADSDQKSGLRTMPGVQVYDDVLFWDDALSHYDSVLQLTADECRKRLTGTWTVLAKLYSEQADTDYASCTARFTAAKAISGEEDALTAAEADETSEIPKYYPTKAASELTALVEDAGKAKAMLLSYQARLTTGKTYGTAEYAGYMQNVATVIAALNDIIASSEQLALSAAARAQQAKLAALEAANLCDRAEAALNNNQFDQARELLARSRTRYTDSLLLEDDEALRKASDARLAALDATMADRHQRIIVTQTRELKTRARAEYYSADFESAERDLARARDLWAITNGTSEDQEITDMLAMINTALSMRTGRFIPVTAPLYPEMSQILSIANQYYNEGASLMKQGQREEANAVLNKAKEQLRKVQLVYPLNQEASLLTLRIDKLIDSVAFERAFERRFKEAKVNGNKQEAYATLTDLYAINPSYPKLAELILNLEYETGLKPRPVDNSGKTKAKKLVTQAQQIYASARGDSSKLDSAVALLNQAISLHPENTDATALKDKIQIEQGARASNILSAADEAAYLVAIQELNKNNIITANAMVEQLMQKGANSRNKKLQLLQRRIKALM